MRDHHPKLPIILALAAFVLAAGWSTAEARRYEGPESGLCFTSLGKLTKTETIAGGEPDQPDNPTKGGNGSLRASRRVVGESDLNGIAWAGRMWATLLLMRLFAR